MRLTCFGLPSVVNIRSTACLGCADRKDCAIAAEAALINMQDKLDVSNELDRIRALHSKQTGVPLEASVSIDMVTTIAVPTQSVTPEKFKVEITEKQKAKLAKLPVKVQEKMRALIASGMCEKAADSLRRGVNPFSREKQSYLALATDLLLKGGFTKAELRQSFMDAYKWKENTAFSRVSSTLGVLTALDLAVDKGDKIIIAPNLLRENTK